VALRELVAKPPSIKSIKAGYNRIKTHSSRIKAGYNRIKTDDGRELTPVNASVLFSNKTPGSRSRFEAATLRCAIGIPRGRRHAHVRGEAGVIKRAQCVAFRGAVIAYPSLCTLLRDAPRASTLPP